MTSTWRHGATLAAASAATFLAPIAGCGASARAPSDGGIPARDATSSDAMGSGDGNGSGGGSSSGVAGSSSSGCSGPVDAAASEASTPSTWGIPPDGGPWSPICPDTIPDAGTRCAPAAVGMYCEYGSAWWSYGCNTVMYCGPQTAIWTNNNPSPSCPPEPGPNCPACPFDPSGLSGSCSSPGLTCHYGEGPLCMCNAAVGNEWLCLPQAGCPSVRPRLGSPCVVSPSAGCNYGCNEGMLCTIPFIWTPANNSVCP